MAEDRRIRRTRKLLQDALRTLILEKGYDKVTVQDILNRADVGRATFYAHFRDKDSLMLSRFEETRASLREHLAGFHRAGAGHTIDVVKALFEHAAIHRPEYRTLVGSRSGTAILALMHRELTKLVRDHFAEIVAGHRLTPAVPVDIAANYVVSAFVALLTQWLDSPRAHTAEQMAQMLQRMILPTMAAALNMPAAAFAGHHEPPIHRSGRAAVKRPTIR
jgi:AcrR family transcriptional regulator